MQYCYYTSVYIIEGETVIDLMILISAGQFSMAFCGPDGTCPYPTECSALHLSKNQFQHDSHKDFFEFSLN